MTITSSTGGRRELRSPPAEIEHEGRERLGVLDLSPPNGGLEFGYTQAAVLEGLVLFGLRIRRAQVAAEKAFEIFGAEAGRGEKPAQPLDPARLVASLFAQLAGGGDG